MSASISSLQKIEDYMNRDQARICVSSQSHILIEGVAGSRKTDTMIRLGLRRHLLEKKNLLFLTQIGSVTDEIRQRVGTYLGQPIFKFGSSNHFLCEHQGCTIEIANFDAWVHRQLEDGNWPLLGSMGAFHHFKAKTLLEICKKEPHKIKGFSLKNGTYADEILVDECQDFEGMKAELMVEFLRLLPKVRSVFAGDKMQTLFEHSLLTEHPMTIFQRLTPSKFSLNKCFRCPKSHIVFTNQILKNALKKNGCKEIVPISKHTIDKPFLFTHGSCTKTFEVHQLCQQILLMLDTLCKKDDTIVPSDVCFLMRKSNNQKVFDFLRLELEKFWSQKGFVNSVIHFATQHDGFRTPIQWEFAENKSCLISIHGDKGKGHKVVFFLGLNQGSLPEECALHKPNELIYDSLLNVALTRSTRYLFIGFHYALPSRYITDSIEELKDLCYCSWMIPKNTPKLYQRLASQTTFPRPLFEKRTTRTKPILVPSLWPISLKDAVRSFERVEDLMGFHPRIQTTKFGQKIKVKDNVPSELLSSTAGIMLWSMVHPEAFFTEIQRWMAQPVLFTDNERLICLVKDYQLNSVVGTPLYRERLTDIKETAHVDILKPLEKTEGYVFSGWLRESLEKVRMCASKRCVPPELWIPLSLLFSEVRGENALWSSSFLPEFPVDTLFSNVKLFHSRLSGSLQFYNYHELKANWNDDTKLLDLGFDPELDQKIFQKGLCFGMVSSSDLLDLEEKTIYFLKSSQADIPKEWILQASICSSLPVSRGMETIPEKIIVVNFMLGKMYGWDKPMIPIKKITEKIMKGFPPEMLQFLHTSNHRKLSKYFQK